MWKGKNVVSFFSSFFLLLYCLWKKRIISSLFPVRTPSLEQEVRTTTRWPQRLDQGKPKRCQVQKHLLKASPLRMRQNRPSSLPHSYRWRLWRLWLAPHLRKKGKGRKRGNSQRSLTDVEKEFTPDNQEFSPLHKKGRDANNLPSAETSPLALSTGKRDKPDVHPVPQPGPWLKWVI